MEIIYWSAEDDLPASVKLEAALSDYQLLHEVLSLQALLLAAAIEDLRYAKRPYARKCLNALVNLGILSQPEPEDIERMAADFRAKYRVAALEAPGSWHAFRWAVDVRREALRVQKWLEEGLRHYQLTAEVMDPEVVSEMNTAISWCRNVPRVWSRLFKSMKDRLRQQREQTVSNPPWSDVSLEDPEYQ